MPNSVLIRWSITFLASALFLFGAWRVYQKYIIQRDGKRMVATVVENDALFRQKGKDTSMVRIQVEVNGERQDLLVERGHRAQYQLGATVEVKLDVQSGELMNTTSRYNLIALSFLFAGLGILAIFSIGTMRYQNRII